MGSLWVVLTRPTPQTGIDAARDKGLSAPPRGGERTSLLLLATQGARNIQARAQEEATIEAEDFWTQAEEANTIEPIG